MKKLSAIMILFIMMFSLSSCGELKPVVCTDFEEAKEIINEYIEDKDYIECCEVESFTEVGLKNIDVKSASRQVILNERKGETSIEPVFVSSVYQQLFIEHDVEDLYLPEKNTLRFYINDYPNMDKDYYGNLFEPTKLKISSRDKSLILKNGDCTYPNAQFDNIGDMGLIQTQPRETILFFDLNNKQIKKFKEILAGETVKMELDVLDMDDKKVNLDFNLTEEDKDVFMKALDVNEFLYAKFKKSLD